MAENLYLKDGSMAILLREDSFARLVGEHMGRDAEHRIRELEETAAMTVQDAKDEIDSDLDSYEASLESNRRAFGDLRDTVETLETLLDAKRIDRRKIRRCLDNMLKTINNQ